MPRNTSANTLLVREGITTPMTSVRCEASARGKIGDVTQFLHGAVDAFPLAQRQRFGIPEKTRCRDWADASELGDLGEADFARLCLFSSHLALISQRIRRLNNY